MKSVGGRVQCDQISSILAKNNVFGLFCEFIQYLAFFDSPWQLFCHWANHQCCKQPNILIKYSSQLVRPGLLRYCLFHKRHPIRQSSKVCLNIYKKSSERSFCSPREKLFKTSPISNLSKAFVVHRTQSNVSRRLKMGHPRPLFVYFHLFKTTLKLVQ